MKKSENKKKTGGNLHLRMGGYSLILVLAVIAVAVIVNMIVYAIPSQYTAFDVSKSDTYKVSDTSRELLSSLSDDIKIYLVTDEASRSYQLYTFLTRYAALSDHIIVEQIDPDEESAFVDMYGVENINSLVIRNENSPSRYKTVDFYDIFEYSEELLSSYYSSIDYFYSQEPITQKYPPDVFDADNEITSAIDYVTTSKLPTVYLLTGHGEAALSEAIISYVEYDNIKLISDFNLISAGAVPDGADVVIINSPTNDIFDGELEILTSYIDGGGKVILVTDAGSYETEKMPNVTALAAHCGLAAHNGVVIEDNTNYYIDSQDFLIPRLQSSAVTEGVQNPGSVAVFMERAHAIIKDEEYKGSMLTSPILVTSDSAYIIGKDEAIGSHEKSEDDITGSFWLGAISKNPETEGALVWYSAKYASSSELSYYNVNTLGLFGNSIVTLCGKNSAVSIDSVRIGSDAVLIFTETEVMIWTALILILIPLSVLVGGFVVWLRRRRV